MLRDILRLVGFGLLVIFVGIVMLRQVGVPDVPGRDPDSTLVMLRGCAGLSLSSRPRPVGRLDETCYREAKGSIELWCIDEAGIARNVKTLDLTMDELLYLEALERYRTGRGRKYVPLSEVRDVPSDERPVFPGAREPSPSPLGPALAALIGGVVVMGLLIAAFVAMGGFSHDDA